VPGAHLLFSAWFDGAEANYLRDLEARMGDRAGRIRGHCVVGPDPRANRLPAGLPFLGYDGATVSKIRAALADAQRFSTFAVQSQGLPAAELRERWNAEFPAP
jgi:hypothetical protein